MIKPMEYAVAAAMESYIHAPRALSLSKVVRQLTTVFPDQDHATLTEQVRRSRRKIRLRSKGQKQFLQGRVIQ